MSRDVTALLRDWAAGDPRARDALMEVVYAELHRRAAKQLRGERIDHSLTPTALVHEAYLRLVDQRAAGESRIEFLALASSMMRRVLVDHARTRGRQKRAGGLRVTLGESLPATSRDVDLIALDDALDALAAIDTRQAKLVELRFFGGLSIDETAQALGVSPATVKRDWSLARAWLFLRLESAG